MACKYHRWLFVAAVVTVTAPLPTPDNNYLVLGGHQLWEAEGGEAAAVVLDRLEKEGLVDIMGHANTVPTFRVFPESRFPAAAALQQAGISYRILVQDLGHHFAEETRLVRRDVSHSSKKESCDKNSCPKPFTDKYMTFEEIEFFLKELAAKSPKVELKSIGKSVEGRNIWRVHINSTSEESTRQGSVWLEGGLHAREWISQAVVLHLIDIMASDTSSVMQDLDVYVVPVANPDGYVYSWTTNRLWRKNRRRRLEHPDCLGVDLNRNWAVGYGVGASGDPCSLVYKGTHPFSEPETQALRDEMVRVSTIGDLRMVMALHSYGQVLMYPWGWTQKEAPNTAKMRKAGEVFAKAAEEERNTKYSVVNSAAGLYFASGATDDWAKGELGTPYSYTLELPDIGFHGFILPANHILPAAQDVWRGLQKLLPDVR